MLSIERGCETVEVVVRMHAEAEIVGPDAPEGHGGGAQDVRLTAAELKQGLARFPDILAPEAVAAYGHALDAGVTAHVALLDRRLAEGWVRSCHGYLHLNNICMVDGHPAPFDAAEANDRFRLIDVLYDLAFLLMDLEFRGLRGHANAALNRYVARAGDPAATIAGLAAMPLFLSLRAANRGHK